jgi:uncharacterized protein
MSTEKEYFAKVEREKKDRLKHQLDEEHNQEALNELKKLHHHRCGKCGAAMDSKAFRGVEIELCPVCGAVLLDAGELETLAGTDQSGVIAGIFSAFGRQKGE